jgi:hypothetical protein
LSASRGRTSSDAAPRRRSDRRHRSFSDHHLFKPREIEALIELAGARGALLATTEKDRVRLSTKYARAIVPLPVTLRFEEPRLARGCCAGPSADCRRDLRAGIDAWTN